MRSLLILGLILAVTAAAQADEVSRGPFEIRDEFIPAQVRLTLPGVSPDPLGRGRWRFAATFNWGNDFSFSQTGPAEDPRSDRRFIIDGEHRTFELKGAYGLTDTVDIGARIPIQWRGAGILDPFIDWFHSVFPSDDNDRPVFLQNKYRIEGRGRFDRYYTWNDSHGTGLGNIELNASWAILRPRHAKDWRVGLVGRVGLPTGTGPYKTGSVDVGAQLTAAKRLARRWDLFGGIGGTYYTKRIIRGFEYLPWRGHAFLALEFRPWRRLSVILQADYSTRLLGNIDDFPAVQLYSQLGIKADLGRRWQGVLGITENLIDQQTTLDVGFWLGFEKRF